MAGDLRYRGERVEPPATCPPTSTFYNFKTREQARRKGEVLSPLAQQALQDPETVRESIMQRAVSIWDYEQERLEQLRQRGKMDPRLFAQQIKNAPTVMAMLKIAANAKKANKGPERVAEEQKPDETPDELETLVQAHEGSSRGMVAA